MAEITSSTEFAGKRALVTGGTKGMGKAIAERFLQAGAKVMTTARKKPEQAESAIFVEADVSTAYGSKKIVEAALCELGASTSLSMLSEALGHLSGTSLSSMTTSGRRRFS